MKDFQFLLLCIIIGSILGTSQGIRDDIKNQTQVLEEIGKTLKELKH